MWVNFLLAGIMLVISLPNKFKEKSQKKKIIEKRKKTFKTLEMFAWNLSQPE